MRLDLTTIFGLALALGGIGFGLVLEGGSLVEILQPTAALIVFGGSFGATLVAQPLSLVRGALLELAELFREPEEDREIDIDFVCSLANDARRGGIIALEKQLPQVPDPFLCKAVSLVVDGIDSKEIYKTMTLETEQTFARAEARAGVLETAGGFAPTIGIIGAVLGLIQVMKHLQDIDEVGKGIAVAFVATVYGVGLANLLLLPAAKKIVTRAERVASRREMLVEGAMAIAAGLNPRLIRITLQNYLDDPPAGLNSLRRADAAPRRAVEV